MSSSGSVSGSNLDYLEKMALRIALERFKVGTGGSSGSRASPHLQRWRSADAGAGPSRPARSDARTTQSAPPPRRLHSPSATPSRGQRWMLVPTSPTRTRTPELEALAARGACTGEGRGGAVRAPPPRDGGGPRQGRTSSHMNLPPLPHDGRDRHSPPPTEERKGAPACY